MNICGLSSFKEARFSNTAVSLFEDVSMFYHRRGVGDTVTFWKIGEQVVYEDHKGDRFDFEQKYNCDALTRTFHKTELVELEEALFLFHSDDNPGHTFSNVLRGLYIYVKHCKGCQVVVPSHILAISNFIRDLIELFVPAECLVIIESDELVRSRRAFIYRGSWFFLHEYVPFVRDDFAAGGRFRLSELQESLFSICPEVMFLKQKLIEERNLRKQDAAPSKVALLKTQYNISSTTKDRAFGQSYVSLLENNGFESITPERVGIRCLFDKIYNARNIITSWGAISFLNKIFVNPEARVLFLCHSGYRDEYARNSWQLRNCYVPVCRASEYIFDLQADLEEFDVTLIERVVNG